MSLMMSGLFLEVSIFRTTSWVGFFLEVLETISTGLPVVISPYIPAAEIPIPCWPRDIFSLWNFDPYSSLPNIRSICFRTIPGPLSLTEILNRVSESDKISTRMSGRIPASSQASSALSTASLTVASSAFRGLSNPNRWRFLAKNSLTEISRCWLAIVSAEARVRPSGLGRLAGASVVFGVPRRRTVRGGALLPCRGLPVIRGRRGFRALRIGDGEVLFLRLEAACVSKWALIAGSNRLPRRPRGWKRSKEPQSCIFGGLP